MCTRYIRKILEVSVMTYLEENNILGEVQGAFRKNRKTEDHIFTLQGICSIRKAKKYKTCLAFLDLSKAFDRVWRDGLFYLLWKTGIQGKCWKLLKSLYSNVSNKVLFGDCETGFLEFGVKYGWIGILALLFFFYQLLILTKQSWFPVLGLVTLLFVAMQFESLLERQASIYTIGLFMPLFIVLFSKNETNGTTLT